MVLLTAFKRRADKKMRLSEFYFSSSMALGVSYRFNETLPARSFILSILKLLAVSQQTLKVMGSSLLSYLLLIIFYRQIQYTMLIVSRRSTGIPTGLIYFAFNCSCGYEVLSLQAVGQALVLALLIIPGTIAIQLTKRLPEF